MESQIEQVEFTRLRHAYITIKSFLENESRVNVNSLKTTLAKDLGLYGDDNLELLEKFVKKFELSHNGFPHEKHFYSEGEFFDPAAALFNLLILPVWLPLRTIELLTLNMVKLPKPGFFEPERDVTDLTFKDLVIWYIKGEYPADREIRYVIKTLNKK